MYNGHQMHHVVTMISILRLPNESSSEFVNRILSNNDLLVQAQRLISIEYTIDLIRAILLNPEFQRMLDQY